MNEPELPSAEDQVKKLKIGNDAILHRIEQMGFDTTNVKATQLQEFIIFLVDRGILTEEERWDFYLLWESKLNEDLMGLELQAKRMIEDARQAARRNNGGVINPARANSLIIPDHLRGPRRNGGRG